MCNAQTTTCTIWICHDCVEIVKEGGVPIVAVQGAVPRIAPGSLITLGFRDADDHHTDCDLRNSVAAVETDQLFGVPNGEQANDLHDCNASCEEWDTYPYDCHTCGEGADCHGRYAATLWPAPQAE
jgi:hypothetical protein